MNTGLKNKLLIMATAAGLGGFAVACGGSEAPAAEEGAAEETVGGEGSCAGAEEPMGEEAAPSMEEGAAEEPATEGEEAAGGEGSCGEGSCS